MKNPRVLSDDASLIDPKRPLSLIVLRIEALFDIDILSNLPSEIPTEARALTIALLRLWQEEHDAFFAVGDHSH